MSTINVEALLRQYNKDLYKRNDEFADTEVSATPKLASGSYASPIEFMLDKYRSDTNFDPSMFNEATKLGEEETYLSLVAKNEGQQLSEQFYDPKYRSYESAILELYKGLADNENKEEQFIEEFDPTTGEWNEVSIGEMTERERIQYDLDQAYAVRDAEITKQLEQYRKETMTFLEKAGSHTAAVGLELTEGVTTALAGILDFGFGFLAATAAGIEGDNVLDAYVNYFGTEGLMAMNKQYFRTAIDEYERKYTTFRTIDGEITGAGKYVANIANSIGMMLPSILLSIPTGGTSLTWLGSASFYAAVFSGNLYDNATRAETVGSPSWVKITNAAFTASAEYLIEWGLGKILGGTIQNSLIGLRGKGLPGGIRELSKLSGFQYLFKSAGQEGLEEFLQDFGTHCINECYALWSEGYGQDGVSLQTLIDAFFAGVLSSFVLSGAAIGRNKVRSISQNLEARKKGTYNKDEKFGPGDIVIETELGKRKKLGGATLLYYQNIVSDFNEALRTLENSRGKIGDIRLAEEVYTGLNEMAQYFAGFSKSRLENCQKLLNRVLAKEQQLSGVKSPGLVKTAEAHKADAVKAFADDAKSVLNDMLASPKLTAALGIKIDKNAEKLTAGGVTEITGVKEKNSEFKRARRKGILKKKPAETKLSVQPDAEESFEQLRGGQKDLSAKAEATLDDLSAKEYEHIFTTDGHVAIDDGDLLFVPEQWLENYTSTEIYEFLVQGNILEVLASAKNTQPIVEQAWEFAEKFTGKKLDWEEALMNLLFNKNMYQAFLLSSSGENFHKFSEFLLSIPVTIKLLADQYKDSPIKKQMIERVFNRMRDAMREPTLKAVLNWNYTPQKILADLILTPRDLEFIEQRKNRTETLAKGSGGAYRALIDTIIEATGFWAPQDIVQYALNVLDDPNATVDQQLEARGIIDYLDVHVNGLDYSEETPDDLGIPINPYAFLVPADAAAVIENNEIDVIQHLTDARQAFQSLYGISAEQMITGDFSGMSFEQRNLVQQEMAAQNYGNIVEFTIRTLENMLGPDYVVVPNTRHTIPRATVFDLKRSKMLAQRFFDDLPTQITKLAEAKTDREKRLQQERLVIEAWSRIASTEERYLESSDRDPDIDNFIEKFEQVRLTDYPAAIRLITESENLIESLFDKVIDAGRKNFITHVSSFKIAKAVPASQFFSTDIMNLTVFERDEIFEEMFSSVSSLDMSWFRKIIDVYFKTRTRDMTKALGGLTEEEVQGYGDELLGRSDEDLQSFLHTLYDNADEVVNPTTGEVVYQIVWPDTGELLTEHAILQDLFYDIRTHYGNVVTTNTIPLSKFIDISRFPEIKDSLSNVTVHTVNETSREGGHASPYDIEINLRSSDYFATLAHEINHVLQYHYRLPNGFHWETAKKMADLLSYVAQHYPRFVKLISIRTPLYELLDTPEVFTPEYILHLTEDERDTLGTAAYYLVQGELWARSSIHNERVHGFVQYWDESRGRYMLLSPDGNYTFATPYTRESPLSMSASAPVATPDLAGAAMAQALKEIHSIRKYAEDTSYRESDEIRNTYHSGWTKGSAVAVLIDTGVISAAQVLQEALYGEPITIDRIIKNPERLLTKEFIDEMLKWRADLSEGNVFYYLKEWIEDSVPGISIDRSSTDHEYILVDDNAFDNLLLPKMVAKAESDGQTIVKKFPDGEAVLRNFYSESVLHKFGIDPNIPVVIKPNVNNEFVVDKYNPFGIIYIQADAQTRDVRFLDTLNHEFRHLMQRYNKLEGGFTPNFTVSAEMVADFEKHVPGLFADAEVKAWAQKSKGKEWKEYIIRHAVYSFDGGELNAFGIKANFLTTKPIYATYEGGKATVFLPWYDPSTGEGRHVVSHLANRDDGDVPPITPPKKPRKPKGFGKGFEGKAFKIAGGVAGSGYDLPTVAPLLKDDRRRYVSKKQAEGTNLEYFTKKLKPNEQLQMDPRVQDFVVHADLDKLSPPLAKGIKDGILNLDLIRGWLVHEQTVLVDKKGNVDPAVDYTIGLLAKYIYKNKFIKTARQLQNFVNELDMGRYWAMAIVFRRGIKQNGQLTRVVIEDLLASNDVEALDKFYESLEGTDWKKAIDEQLEKFSMYYSEDEGDYIPIESNDTLSRGARALALERFDGTIAGAFFANSAFRQMTVRYNNELGRAISLNRSTKNSKGEDNRGTRLDMLRSGTQMETGKIVSDLYALYEEHVAVEIDDDERMRMREDLLRAKAKKEGWTSRLANDAEAMRFATRLMSLSDENLVSTYIAWENDGLLDIILQETPGKKGKKESRDVSIVEEYKPGTARKAIQKRIRDAGNTLLKYVREGRVAWKDLPNEVKALFEETEVEVKDTSTGKVTKRKEYKLAGHAYKVGPGKVAIPRASDPKRRSTYSPKHSLTDDPDIYKHSVEDILRNEALIKNTLKVITNAEKTKGQGNSDLARLMRGTIKNTTFVLREKTHEVKVERKAETETKKTEGKKTESKKIVTVKKLRKTRVKSDTPNHFTIVADIEMPKILETIFDTSFNEMADTLVQFASKDGEGKLYTKEDEEFESRLQHEITNWDDFYEANRETLINLTRADVLSILDYFQNGAPRTVNGPMGKLAAFEIFILGYIVDVARHEGQGWHFSETEINTMEKLYEAKASALGSGLNAVGQMKKVIDPFKKIQERYFEDYNIEEDETQDLILALRNVEDARTDEERTNSVEIALAEIHRIEDLMYNRNKKGRGWFKNGWEKMKNWRYTAMLSSPATWARNWLSNVTTSWMIEGSDWLGNVFTKKGYRDDQWNLTGVQVTPEVKKFIDDYFMSNELFDPLYEYTSKYDDAAKIRKRQTEHRHQTMLVQMICEALEKKYAASHRWDDPTMNRITAWVSRMISDRRFVRKATEKYFGKMLTVAMSKGKATIDQGLSSRGVLELFAEAIILANNDYMHKRNWITDMLDTIRLTHPIAHQVITMWQPFASAGWNWFVEALKYSPMGLVTNIVRLSRLEKSIAHVEEMRNRGRTVPHSRFTEYLVKRDIGKGILGGILWSVGVFLALAGVVRVDEEDEKLYIIAGDVKLDVSDIFGTSSILVGTAITQAFIKQTNGTKKSFDETFALMAEYLLGGFILTDLVARHKWDQGAGETVLVEAESFLKSYVPQFWQLFVRASRHAKIKYSSGIMGMFERWINSFVPGMPAGSIRVNPYTGERETKYALPFIGEFLKSGTFGVRIFWSEIGEGELLAKQYNVVKNPLTGEITIDEKKHRLSDTLTLNQVYGKLNAEDLKKIKSQNHRVEMPNGTYKTLSWDQMSDKQRENVLERTFTSNAEIAKVYIWTQVMGHKYYASPSVYEELRKMNFTRNVFQGDKGFVE